MGVPFAVMRTISDNANESAATDFMRFVKSVAAAYAFHIVSDQGIGHHDIAHAHAGIARPGDTCE
jgi:adenosylhomocysteine nucleosidase